MDLGENPDCAKNKRFLFPVLPIPFSTQNLDVACVGWPYFVIRVVDPGGIAWGMTLTGGAHYVIIRGML